MPCIRKGWPGSRRERRVFAKSLISLQSLDETLERGKVPAMSMSEETKAQIEKLLSASKVVLFMKGNKHFPQCGFSSRVVKLLKETGVPFETVNVLSDPNIRDGIKEFSDWPTIPQLYVDKEFLGGCDIVTEMFEAGELHAKLGVQKAAVAAPKITVTSAASKALKEAEEPGSAF
jgi:monothiol glutaredoxin